MKNIRAIVATVLISFAVLSGVLLTATRAVAAEEQKVSAKVGKPLQEALTAGQAKQWDKALAALKDAEAVSGKTPFEEFKINEIYSWVYIQQKRYADAAVVSEKQLSSGFLSAAETDQYIKQITQMYLQTKNYPKAMEYLQRYLKAHPGDVDMNFVLGQLQAQSGQLKPALETFGGLASASEKAGQRPKEDWLTAMYGISYQLAGKPNPLDKGTLNIVEKLLRYYPNEAYWSAMLAGLKSERVSDAYSFQLGRLQLAVGTLKDADGYTSLAQFASNAGYPGEGLAVMDAGYAKNILGTPADKARTDRIKESISKLADADKAALPGLDKKARAAATGQDDVVLGETYMGYGRYPEAIEALERGIKKAGLKKPDQAQIALGLAYLRSGQAEKSKAEFKKVAADSELARIAALWVLHANSK
jgi:tetratricopeptide (TPR) repeat protein